MANHDDASELPASSPMSEVSDKLLAPVIVIAPDSTLIYVNAAAAHAVGQEPAWLIGRRMLPLVHPADRRRIARELRSVAAGRRSGGMTTYRVRTDPAQDWRVFESIADNLLDDPAISGILLSSRDVTDHVAYQQQLQTAAYTDVLTGLPNRAAATDALNTLMGTNCELAVALVGIDRFRHVNDSLGYTAGDEVLRVAAERARRSVPAHFTVARFGGDVLAVLLGGVGPDSSIPLLWDVVARLGESTYAGGYELRLSASAGMAERTTTSSAESLVRDAGLALTRAKSEGGGRVTRFEATMREAAVSRLEMEADLRAAITTEQFRLALQPIVNLADGSTYGAEALLRWSRRGQHVDPAVFIPLAEETGLIVPIGDWVIDRAAELASRSASRITVNLSPRQLAIPGLPERIARILKARRVPAKRLGFEVTETAAIEHFTPTVELLCKIRQLGCQVGLDDFGTGFSSLSHIRRLPLDFIKIDRSLTADLDGDTQAQAIVGAIITMAGAVGLDVIAEGVETQPQRSALAELGCALAQGYLFGPPALTDP